MNLKNAVIISILFLLFSSGYAKPLDSEQEQDAERIRWWREAKFGMFIHWGLYAIPAGEWKTGEVSQHAYSEWIMYHLKIPVLKYEKLAGEFNPVNFNADEWVKLAKETGMKYMVITSKHHDGFSMFDTKATDYDIVDATPFKRDPMKELAEACKREGIKFGFYYSVDRDWHHPDAQGNELKQSNSWDYPDEEKKDFNQYVDEFAMPQIKELLTNYGPLGIIWFDGIAKKTAEQNERIIETVRKYQPDCLINSRLGDWKSYKWGDYRSMDDNRVSNRDLGYGWENPGTLNRSYGYNMKDDKWRSPTEVIRMLVEIASNGGNYLLNIGPKADGSIPKESVQILQEMGRWMDKYSESIYGTSPSPIQRPVWGCYTTKPGKLYVHVFNMPWDRKLQLQDVTHKVKRAYLLADPDKQRLRISHGSRNKLIIRIPTREFPEEYIDPHDTVVVLEVTK